jgi:hypothetical protein
MLVQGNDSMVDLATEQFNRFLLKEIVDDYFLQLASIVALEFDPSSRSSCVSCLVDQTAALSLSLSLSLSPVSREQRGLSSSTVSFFETCNLLQVRAKRAE